MPDEHESMQPGDEAPPDEPSAAEDVCEHGDGPGGGGDGVGAPGGGSGMAQPAVGGG